MTTIERILCPTDLSPESDAALRYAVALARTYEAKLFVCYCHDPSSFVDVAARDHFRERFEAAIRPYTGVTHCLPDCEGLIVEGDPETVIPRVAAERRVDLIVMRSRRRPLAAALLGSTAEAVCRTAPCPVLVTHPDEHEWVGLTSCEVDLRKILVAHDFSIDSELALQYAISMAQEYQAELHLMHVLPAVPVPAGAMLSPRGEGDFNRAARMLDQSIPDEAHLWCRVTQAVKAGQPYREILAYAEEHQIDLICMGVHGAGFAMRALFGSNADRVLRQAPCPVLIARPLRPTNFAPANGKNQEGER
ncbi:MAG TPA: universal stress protein [Blastocatellia bacterium]|nr:universal stress protein [Blastocatellia bacterium]